MLPYLLVLSFVMFWIILERKALNRKSFFMPLIILSVFAGARSFIVGSDSENYTRNFRISLDVHSFASTEGRELGYRVLEYALLLLDAEYFWLFTLTGIIVVYCYLTIIKKYSFNYTFSIFLFITLGVYTFFFNGLRQGISMAIFAISLPYLLEKKLILYLTIVLIASLFHISALFLIPFYYLVNLNIKPLYKLIISFLGSFLLSRIAINYIASSNDRYQNYTEVSESAGGLVTLGFYFLILMFIYFISKIYKIRDEQFEKMFTFYGVGVVFVIPIAMLQISASGPQRLLNYFTWILILILPIIFKKINNTYITCTFVILCMVYFILITTKFSNLTPYVINPIFEIF